MKRRFTILSAALALLVSLAIPMGMWGQTSLATWTFTSANYPANKTNFNATGGPCTNSTFYLNGTGSTWNNTKGYAFTSVTDIDITLKLDRAVSVGETVSFSAATFYNKASNAPMTGFNLTIKEGNGTYSTTGLNVTSWSLTSSSTVYSVDYVVQSNLSIGSTVALKLTGTGKAGAGQGYMNDIAIVYSNGGSTPNTYTVTYNSNGGTGTMTDINSPYEENAMVTLLSNSFTAPEGKIWDSWLVKDASNNTLAVTNNQFTMPASNVTVTAQWVDNPDAPQYEWVLTDWADLEDGDIFVIVGKNSKAMANVTSGGNNPSAIDVTIQNGKITSSVTDNMKWNRAAVTGGYKLLPNGSTTTWLNNTSGTNLRISDGTNNNVFTYTTYSNNNYLKTGDRYACIYNNNDWRAYASSNVSSNATNTTFYRRQLVSTDPVIIASDVSIAYNDLSGTINYTIDNSVSDGSIQAEVAMGATITNFVLGEPGSNAVTFTCDANTSTTATHTATVTLKYVQNNQVLATKNVTVTQAVAPLIYTTIPALFEAATSTSTPVTVSFGNWVVTGVNGSQSFVTDGTNGFIMYQSNHGFQVGNTLSGTTDCNLVLFNGSAQITGLTTTTEGLVVGQNGTVTPVVTTIDALQAINTGSVVTLKNLTYNGNELTDENNNTILYHTTLYNGTTLETGEKYNVTGVFFWFNSTKRILPRSAADIEQIFTLTIPAFNSQNGGYRLISSPVATATNPTNPGDVTNMLTPKDGDNNNTYDLYAFDQDPEDGSGKEWRNYRATNDGFDLEFGKGYLYGNLNGVELVFTGTAYNGDAIVTLTKTDNTSADFPGWNLVGNPFGVNAYIGNRDFYVMEAGSEIILADRVQDGAEYIKPMEGVFVIAANNGEELQFTTTPNGKSSRLGLNLSNGRNVIDRASVRFDEGQQLPKFQLNRNSTKVYIPQDGKDFAVVCAEEMGAMPVNFKAEDNGTYSLNFNSENVEFSYLHLIDNMTGNDVDLLQTPSYSFEAKTTDYESRFKLVFATGDNSNDDTFAFYSNGSFVINNPSTGSGPAELQVIDITGRVVKSESINGCTNVNVNAAPGVYMLRLINGDNVKVQKVVVK